jgi:hypothetical protein
MCRLPYEGCDAALTRVALCAVRDDLHIGRRTPHGTLTCLQDVCEKAKGGQSHTAHRVVAFEPYAPAALFLRIALTLLVIKGEQLHVTFTPVRCFQLVHLRSEDLAAPLLTLLMKAYVGMLSTASSRKQPVAWSSAGAHYDILRSLLQGEEAQVTAFHNPGFQKQA